MRVRVCARCFRASCYYGIWKCMDHGKEHAEFHVDHLRKFDLEHSDYYLKPEDFLPSND